MSKNFKIGDHFIGDAFDPYIIAEIGVNHEGSMELAKRLIKEAKKGGAHSAKFQSYKAEKIAIKNSPAYWDTKKEPTESQFKLFKKYDLFGKKDYVKIAEYCKEIGIDFMSTPFDLDAVDFLAPLVPTFKIASADITNVPLIRKCASKNKPLIISTGAATLPEIEFALQTGIRAGAKDIALLHCVLNYPTKEENAQLGMIKVLRRVFPDVAIGYSDHVVPDSTISALEVATLFGCCILEKHFTHDKSLTGNDHYHAMDKEDLTKYKNKLQKYRLLIGGENKNIEKEKVARLHARRSIVSASYLKPGELISETDLICKRPGHGISPIHWDDLIGRKVSKEIVEDTLIAWDDIE